MSKKIGELGKKSEYIDRYDPKLLFPIKRKIKRDEIEINNPNDLFFGVDLWNAYEISCLTKTGVPKVYIGVFKIDAQSENIIESKSFKLYLNSFNQEPIQNKKKFEQILIKDLSKAAQFDVEVNLYEIEEFKMLKPSKSFKLIDKDFIPKSVTDYIYDSKLLKCKKNKKVIKEKIYTNLLKSNCLVTNQPDWGSLFISYEGQEIDKQSLLKYIFGFRKHNEFHEQCVERIFNDIMKLKTISKLTVYARYTRRGGLDINPFRSNFEKFYGNYSTPRQ